MKNGTDAEMEKKQISGALKAKIVLEAHPDIRISMDGVGWALDNVYIERFWRTLKYEYVYLWKRDRIRELRIGLGNFIEDYNHRREHSALGKQPPWTCYSLNRWCEEA